MPFYKYDTPSTYIPVSLGLEPWVWLHPALCFWVSSQTFLTVWAGLYASEGSSGEGSTSCLLVGFSSVGPSRLDTWGPFWLLARGFSLSPMPHGPPQHGTCFIGVWKPGRKWSTSKVKRQPFALNHRSDILLLLPIPFVRSKSLGVTHIHRGRISEQRGDWEAGSTWQVQFLWVFPVSLVGFRLTHRLHAIAWIPDMLLFALLLSCVRSVFLSSALFLGWERYQMHPFSFFYIYAFLPHDGR